MRVDVIAGRFALCDPFAGGSTGTVWRAWDLKQRRYCAAKVLRQRDSGDLIRFTREQAVRLAHRHVLTPYSWVAEDEHVLIASDLIDGGSVSTLIGDWGPLSPATVADLTAQLLDGLAHVHETGLTHRDVKPGNVLLDTTPRPAPPGRTAVAPFTARLADFGLAVRSDDARLTQHGLVIGTPGYLSPEALAGDVPAPAQDLYAAGRLALALLTGREPVDVDEPPDFSALPSTSTLAMVVRALLSDDPDQRPDAATARDVLRSSATSDSTEPRTAFGEPVTLSDQLPPFPSGWNVGGPDPSLLEPSRQDRPDLGAITSAVPIVARPVAAQPVAATPATGPPVAAGPESSRPDPAAPFAPPAFEAPFEPQPKTAVDTPAAPSAPPSRSGRGGPDRWRSPGFIAAVAAAIVWMAALGYLISDVISKAHDAGPASSSTSSSGAARTTSSPTTRSATTTPVSSGIESTATPSRTVTTPPPPALNGVCAFAQEGNEVTSASTTLRCTRVGSTFVWKKV